MNWVILCLKRFLRRLRYSFNLKEVITWEYESCKRCGKAYNFFYLLKDNIWNKITTEDNCLCIDCLIKLANKKDIKIKMNDFEYIDILNIKR